MFTLSLVGNVFTYVFDEMLLLILYDQEAFKEWFRAGFSLTFNICLVKRKMGGGEFLGPMISDIRENYFPIL